jgi:uncharacterized membrane protein YqjE
MDSDAPVGAEPSRPKISDSLRNGVASVLHYLELRLRLIGLESKEAGMHLLLLVLLFVATVIFFGGFLVMLIVFFLYLLMLIFHWEWGWSALACGGFVLILSVVSGIILRFRIVRPIYPSTLEEFKKDRVWLRQTEKKVE